MKKKYLIYTILPITAFTIVGGGIALACGWFGGMGNFSPDEIAQRQQTMFEREAQILGISVDEVKNYWAEGKTIKEIMEEKGITQEQIQTKMREIQLQEMRSFLQTLVEKGIITQTQADKRLEIMKNRLENGKVGRGFRMGIGFGRRLDR